MLIAPMATTSASTGLQICAIRPVPIGPAGKPDRAGLNFPEPARKPDVQRRATPQDGRAGPDDVQRDQLLPCQRR